VLCFGGTKNGMNSTEGRRVFQPPARRANRLPLQAGRQLASKMRFLSRSGLMLQDGAWLRHGRARQRDGAKARRRIRASREAARRGGGQRRVRRTPSAVFKALHGARLALHDFIGAQGCG